MIDKILHRKLKIKYSNHIDNEKYNDILLK